MRKFCLFVAILFGITALGIAEDSALVKLAKQEKERREKVEAKKTFTNADIDKVKGKQLGIETTSTGEIEEEKEGEKEEGTQDESYWQSRKAAAQQRVNAAQARVDELQTDVNNLSRAYYQGTADGVAQQPLVESERGARMGELDTAKAELEAARAELVGLEDEARKAGVPPGWVR